MKQKTVPWDEATLHELKMFAAQVLGMMTMPNIGETTLRAKIRQAYNGENITIMVEETAAPADAPKDAPIPTSDASVVGKALRGSSAALDPKVKITITEVEEAGGKRPVFVGVNGVGMLIPRGRPVDIPYRYYDALKNAIKRVHVQDETTNEIISSDVPSYPFSVNVMPAQADIDAYLAAEQRPAA